MNGRDEYNSELSLEPRVCKSTLSLPSALNPGPSARRQLSPTGGLMTGFRIGKLGRFSMRAAAFALTTSGLLSPAAARAGVVIVSQSAEVDAARERAFFTLEFDAVPDFYTLGEFGQAKDAFQYEIDGDGAAEG